MTTTTKATTALPTGNRPAGTTVAPRGLVPVLAGNMLLDALEVSVAIVALPSIGADLGGGAGGLHWVVTGFALGFGLSLLPGTAVVARFGRRRVFLAALLGFAVTSVAGALAASLALLVVTRVLKGVCVALTAPTGLAIIGAAFPDGPQRRRAVATYAMFGACGFGAGLLLSGLLTEWSWRATFLFPAPVALALFVAALRLVPRDGDRPPAAGAPAPSAALAGSMVGAAALNGTLWGLLYVAVLHLQRAGWSPPVTGVALLPAALPLVLATPFAGRLVAAAGPARLVVGGLGLLLTAHVVAWLAGPDAGYGTRFLPALVLVGLAFALAFTALHVEALSGRSPGEQGGVTATYQTAVQLGGALVLGGTATTLALAGERPATGLLAVVAAAALLARLTRRTTT